MRASLWQGGLAAALTGALVVSGACASNATRPGRLGDCPDAAKNCVSVPPGSQTPGHDGGTDASLNDAGGDASASLSGTVVILQDPSFSIVSPFSEPAQIIAQGLAGAEVTANYDGTNPFQMSGVRYAASVWMTVTPTSGVSGALPTLQPVDTIQSPVIQLYLVSSSVLDNIYSVLTQPVQRQAGSAQIVLRFEDSGSLAAVANVEVTQHPGGTLIYDSGGTWSDVATGTGQFGMVIVANALPGVADVVKFQVGTTSTTTQQVTVQGAVGTVTYASVSVQP
jgi:hypothetical protein